jgi:outer membrane receptor protein involved in Fe transport
MTKFKLSSIMLVIASSISINAVAQEENAKSSFDDSIEKIIIQGSKQELTLQEVDASVEVFNEARLSAEHIVDIGDLLTRIPNVSSTGSENSITIRGIGRNGATGTGRGVTSNVYLDGSPLSGTALGRGVTSLWDTQQAEVLRGSQSSIQGRNALAGAIVLTSADPTYTPEGKIRLTYAENNTYQLAGAYGNAIVKDQLAFRLAADIQKTDGYIKHDLFDKNTNFEDRLMLRAKFLFEPDAIDALSMKLTIDHNDIKIGNGGSSIRTSFSAIDPRFETFDPYESSDSGDNPRNNTETTRVILDTYYELSEHWGIKNILTHEQTKVDRVFGGRDLLDTLGSFTNNFFDEEVNTAELRFTFDYDNITGVIGGYYFKAKTPSLNTNESLLSPTVAAGTQGFGFVTPDTASLIYSYQSETTTKNAAIFAQARIDLSDSFILDLGIRYDDEQFDNTGIYNEERIIEPATCLATVPGALLGQPVDSLDLPCATLVSAFLGEVGAATPEAANYNAWLPKATLTYKINDEHSVFASAQRGYRAGGSYITTTIDPNDFSTSSVVDTYDPEYLVTFEIGSRSVFSDGDIVFNTNAFYSNYTDQQVSLPGDNLTSAQDDIIANAAESTIYGLELTVEYFISQEWDIYASLGLLHAEYDDFPYADVGEFSNLEGKTLPGTASVSASIGANWRSDNGWFANISGFYSSSRPSDSENLVNSDLFQVAVDNGVSSEFASTFTEDVDAYVNVNLRFGYELNNITLYAFGTNVLNEEVVTSRNYAGIDQRTGEVSLSLGGTTSRILPPRTFGIGVDYSF